MNLVVLVVEDEPPVREALLADLGELGELAEVVRLEAAEDVADAWEVVSEVEADGDLLALVLSDHRLPGESGVDMLVAMQDDERTLAARKVLVTGQADQADTIRAVNDAGLDYYIGKPWEVAELQAVVREQLTDFVLAEGIDPLPHLRALDQVRVLEQLR